MYHGVPLNYDLLVFAFGAIVWVVRSLFKAVRQMNRRIARPPTATPPLQTQPMAQGLPPAQPLLTRETPLARERPRQPSAGGPTVPRPATSRSFQRQEQEAAASESAAFQTPPDSSLPPAAPPVPNTLFRNTDDLVRALIFQEVLGPPLSKRAPSPAPRPVSPP